MQKDMDNNLSSKLLNYRIKFNHIFDLNNGTLIKTELDLLRRKIIERTAKKLYPKYKYTFRLF